MKSALFKDGLNEIKKNFRRFLALLLMSFLGVGFFAGIRAASYDMKLTLDDYYKKSRVYDINVVSTLGITDRDLKNLSNIDGVEAVAGGIEKDTLVSLGTTSYAAARLMLYDDSMNIPILSRDVNDAGAVPDSSDENWCLVDSKLIERFDKSLGDFIDIKDDDLKESSFKIVGVVDSPLFMSSDRGNNKYASGRTDFFVYVPKEALKPDVDVYTNAYISVYKASDYETNSSEYKAIVDKVEDNIAKIKDESESYRYNTLKTEAEEKIRDAEDSLKTELKDAKDKIDDGLKEIKNGLDTLSDAKKSLATAEDKLKDLNANKAERIEEAKAKLQEKNAALVLKQQEIEEQRQKLLASQEALDASRADIDAWAKNAAEAKLLPVEQIQKQLDEKYAEIAITQESLNNTAEAINIANKGVEQQFTMLNEQKAQIIENVTAAYEEEMARAEAKINKKKAEIKEQEAKLLSEQSKLKSQRLRLEKETRNANADIRQAKKDLSALKYTKWHILNRDDNPSYNGFIRDILSVARLGGLFPIILFLIAALISLNSMTRMVEEQRVQIGTLKALGYTPIAIAKKYIYFAALACVIGGVFGMSLGFIMLPRTIWKMYDLDYSLPVDFRLSFDYRNGAIGLGVMLGLIVLATAISIYEEIKEHPAILMRPKAPKKAKRVLLERVDFIWKNLSFSYKVTLRNIFRYKKRFLMTIIGIMGCTSLVLSGFGLRDCVSHILEGQYGKIFKYDMLVRISDNLNVDEQKQTIADIESIGNIEYSAGVNMSAISVRGEDRSYDAQLVVADDIVKLRDVINLHDRKSHVDIDIATDKIYISDKLAELVGVGVGSTVTIVNDDDKEITGTVGGILENYLSHYVYVSRDFYNKNIDDFSVNALIIKNDRHDKETESAQTEKLIKIDNVEAVILSSTMIDRLSVMMSSLNYVVAILVVAAALLNFIVLYNLSNLNISERSRELATIKVLGFYDREVYGYLDRETILLTIIGIALGMFGGHYLNALIVKTCEVDNIRFTTQLSVFSYLISAGISLAFAFLVNVITYFLLKRVNMIDSLKSVE